MADCRVFRGPTNRPGGYGRVPFGRPRVRADGRPAGRHSVQLHRWVVEQVEGRPLAPGEIVMHTCDNPPCFLYEHLRRATQADNVHDAEAKGRGVRTHGSAHPNAKLTEAEALAIFVSPEPRAVVAAQFGVSETLVSKIRRGESWAHVTRARPAPE